MNRLVQTRRTLRVATGARSAARGVPGVVCRLRPCGARGAFPLGHDTPHCYRLRPPRLNAASETQGAPETQPPELQPNEWGEVFERDWEGQRTDAHASEPEDLGFAALCSLILLLGVGIFSMTRPAAVRPAAAQYVTRQPNITLIVERDAGSSERDEPAGGPSTVGGAPQDARPRGAAEEDTQDFLHTADELRPMSDMHASLEQQLGRTGPSAFPTPRRHDDRPLADSDGTPSASASQPAVPQQYPPLDPSTSYTAFPDDTYPSHEQPEPSLFQQLDRGPHTLPTHNDNDDDDDRPPAYLTGALTPTPPDPIAGMPYPPTPTAPHEPNPLQDAASPLAAASQATASDPAPTPPPASAAPPDAPGSSAPLPQLQAEQPSHAVELSELQHLPPDSGSLQNMRERAQIAMRASAAAGEASHRAAAYSAAASSASSKAAEAAERATVAASALQRALEERSEEAISGAEARIARALELAGDAESRAASAAALATAYQDIAQTQASVAEQVSAVASKGTSAAPAGAAEAASAAKSSQLPFLQGLQGQWRLARWQLQLVLEHAAQSCGAAAAAVARFVTVAIVQPLLGVWAWLVSQF